MREESHLDDMRRAIRGDFERLAERRGTQELMHESPPEREQKPPDEPEPAASQQEAEPAADAPEEADSAAESVAEEGVPRRGFFARLLGL